MSDSHLPPKQELHVIELQNNNKTQGTVCASTHLHVQYNYFLLFVASIAVVVFALPQIDHYESDLIVFFYFQQSGKKKTKKIKEKQKIQREPKKIKYKKQRKMGEKEGGKNFK